MPRSSVALRWVYQEFYFGFDGEDVRDIEEDLYDDDILTNLF